MSQSHAESELGNWRSAGAVGGSCRENCRALVSFGLPKDLLRQRLVDAGRSKSRVERGQLYPGAKLGGRAGLMARLSYCRLLARPWSLFNLFQSTYVYF